MTLPAAGQLLGAGAATVALVVLPSVIVNAPPAQPTPESGALVVELSGGEGAATPFPLAVDAPGSPTGATMHDDTGLDTAKVEPLGAARCASAEHRTVFGDSGAGWCLQLADVAAGSELKGTVKGSDGTSLALTVRRRDGFVLWPLVVLLAGIACGFAAAVFPRWLGGLIRRIVLAKLVAQHKTITGLREWVTTGEAEGIDREEIIAAVDWAIRFGTAVADRAKRDLLAAIADADARGVDHPLLKEARRVAVQAEVRMTDLYDGIERRKVHPAQEQAIAVRRLTEIHTELEDEKVAIAALPRRLRAEPQALVDQAAELCMALSDIADLPRMDAPLDSVAAAVAKARAQTARDAEDLEAVSVRAVARTVRTAARGPLAALLPLDGSPSALNSWTWIARVLTGIAIAVVLVFAFFTVKHAAYDEAPLFHASTDYLKLFTAALGSSAAATVLGLLGYWRPGTPSQA